MAAIAVEAYPIVVDDLTKGEHVDGKEDGSKHRALRHAFC